MKKYKIFTTPWHNMHFYDLFNATKEWAEYFLVPNTNRKWFEDTRPLPENSYFVSHYEKGKYDYAILDVDQQLANPNIGKRKIYCELNDLIQDIPKIVINHANPVYPEFLQQGDMTPKDAERLCIKEIKKIVGDNPMIVNSHDAVKEWGWGHPIIHGMNSADWWDNEKEPRVFTSLSPGGCDEYYNRYCMNEIARLLDTEHGYRLAWARVNVKTDINFDTYREFLSRSLIYIDTSFRTPMNRARTEAMFSGCCVVQVEGCHDQNRFLKDGENCILVPNNPKKIVKILVDLIENRYFECIEIGKRAKKYAQENFTYKRYSDDWHNLINKKLKI